MGQRTDRIEADIAPELEPDFVVDALEHRRLHSGLGEQHGQPLHVRADLARWFADRKAVAVDMADHAWGYDLGRGVDDASDGALWTQFAPLPAAGIDAFQRRALVAAAMLVEIPIGNSIDRGDDAGVRPEQWLHRLDHAGDGMGLQADDNEILMSEFGGVIGAARMHHTFFITNQQFEPVGAHGGEMCPPCHEADVGACARELYSEISADRTGAVDTDFHGVLRRLVTENASRPHSPALSGTQSQRDCG